MKRVVGLILLALGVMFLVLAPLLKFYVLPAAAKTPLDQYTETTADVQFRQVLNPTKVAAADKDPYDRDFEATQYIYVRGDVPAAEQPEAKEQDLGIFDYFMRVNRDDTGALVTASSARYPFNRVTSELADCCGASVDDEPVSMAGSIMPVKWGFDLQQQDYPIFNTTIKAPQTFSFVREEDKFGVSTYVYESEVPPTKTDELEVPTAALPGEKKNAEGNTILDEMYSSKSTYYMEPLTGQIIYGESSEYTTYDYEGEVKLVKADYTGVSGSQESADEAAKLASQVKLVGSTLPLVFGVLGLILGGIGLLLMRGKKDGSGDTAAAGGSTGGGDVQAKADDATAKVSDTASDAADAAKKATES